MSQSYRRGLQRVLFKELFFGLQTRTFYCFASDNVAVRFWPFRRSFCRLIGTLFFFFLYKHTYAHMDKCAKIYYFSTADVSIRIHPWSVTPYRFMFLTVMELNKRFSHPNAPIGKFLILLSFCMADTLILLPIIHVFIGNSITACGAIIFLPLSSWVFVPFFQIFLAKKKQP